MKKEPIYRQFDTFVELVDYAKDIIKNEDGRILVLGDKQFRDNIVSKDKDFEKDSLEFVGLYDVAIVSENCMENINKYNIEGTIYVLSTEDDESVLDFHDYGIKDDVQDELIENFEDLKAEILDVYKDNILSCENEGQVGEVLDDMFSTVYKVGMLDGKASIYDVVEQDITNYSEQLKNENKSNGDLD